MPYGCLNELTQSCFKSIVRTHVVIAESRVTHISVLIKQVVQIIIVPTALASVHSDLLRLLLLLAHSFQDAFQLLFVDFLA